MEQTTMKALVYHGPGQYSLDDVPVPQILEPTDVIGRVTLAAICTSDIHAVRGEMPGVPVPKIMGHEFCIEIVEVGAGIKNWQVGDRCVSRAASSCGECPMCKAGVRGLCPKGGVYGSVGPLQGCHAEYIRIPFADTPEFLYKIPAGLSEEDVILTPDMLATAYYGLEKAEIKEGQSVAVIGTGPVGLSACMLAKKLYGAGKVIAVDILQNRIDLALQEGVADVGVNAATEDAVARILEATNGVGVDIAFETPGLEETMQMCAAVTRHSGIISTIAVFAEPLVKIPMLQMIYKNQQLKMGIQKSEGVPMMLEQIQAGKLDARFILTHRAPLNDIEKGYEIFGNRQDGCVKWLITPYER
jgi:alcohol dehydrogenase